jgi:hypothetical protein
MRRRDFAGFIETRCNALAARAPQTSDTGRRYLRHGLDQDPSERADAPRSIIRKEILS